MKAVEVKFDLNNPNQKPIIEIYEITKETERYLHAKADEFWKYGRRFFKPNMNEAKYNGKLEYSYRFTTNEEDYETIYKSKEMKKAIREIKNILQGDLDCYQWRLNGVVAYYNKCFGEV
ncbi:hypothetical protein [Clostridium sp. HBUAS56017]|uniref:hypothetical protein n=1 Tax=Clostridium sp. HBUAS56017 TaxID=2571128 RepID=UPI001177F782|nr:hypothetical protein [Clostridium sp. HBUAS56017]